MKIREELGIESRKPIVISVGAFIPRKRYEDLIEAVLNCKSDCELYLVGGKPTEAYLKLSADSDIPCVPFGENRGLGKAPYF